jgi:hypothetical protein
MTNKDLMELYDKERDYQTLLFGDYSKSPALNFGSFIIFLDQYIEKIIKAYVDKWDNELPPWLIDTAEYEQGHSAPVEAYEHLVKLMALAGAALEIYTSIDIEKWRSEGVNKKWEN